MTDPAASGLVFELARVTLQLTSPLTIGGGEDLLVDQVCVVDANGLPTLPGTSLAGVLRHLVAGPRDPSTDEICRRAFGFQKGDRGDASLIELSWAQVHDKEDRPIPLRAGALDPADEVLAFIAAGVVRDHVRLDGHGAVDGTGKFDLGSVPVGTRFSFELLVHDGSPFSAKELLAILTGPTARLGMGTRRGLGAFRLLRALGRRFNLATEPDRLRFMALPRDLSTVLPPQLLEDWLPDPDEPASAEGFVSGRLLLQPEDFWLVGGGDPSSTFFGGLEDAEPDIVPLTEKRVIWNETDHASVGRASPLLPASSIKGALRHRAAYHLRRLKGLFAPAVVARADELPPELDDLFGAVRTEVTGQPGRIFFDDVWAEAAEPRAIDHVSIDRFSGGPLDGHLFREAPLSGPTELEVPLSLDLRRDLSPEVLNALRCALEDLCEGRLALGGGANRGHGYFKGQLVWKGEMPWPKEAREVS